MDPDLLKRIQRLYVAIGRVVECDLSLFPARISESPVGRLVVQDFNGGQSEADLSETLHGLIANVASFHDHLQKWGQTAGITKESVHNFFKEFFDFCVVRDLWNIDKHGEYNRLGWSRRSPRLANIHRSLRLQTQATPNSTVAMTLATDGRPVVSGDGHGFVIITADVVDAFGNGLGDAERFMEKSIKVCDVALRRFGVNTD